MRSLFVIGGLAHGGAESQVILASKELARLGHGVGVYVLSGEGARSDELAGTAVDLVIDRKRRRLDAAVLARLRRHIARQRPDIVHGFKFDGDLYARIAACGTGIPVLGSERTENQQVPLIQRIGYRLTSTLCDGIIANSLSGAEFARRLHRRAAEEVDVMWNGIELERLAERVARSPHPARAIFPGEGLRRLAMVASIKPDNDHILALRALRRLLDQDPSWRLVCFGDEPAQFRGCKSAVLAERDRLRLEPYVRFAGHRRDVLELIADSDVFLMTARHGAWPNVALEAMACGTVVVSTDYGDVRRVLPVPGQVAAARSDIDIAQAILQSWRERAEIARAQRRWVDENASASASTGALLKAYSKYAAAGPLRWGRPGYR